MAPRLITDLHTHTRFSHGKGSPEDNILAAIDMGLTVVAITDHGVRQLAHGVRRVDEYFAEIERLKEKYFGKISILAGIEANILSKSGEIDVDQSMKARLDIVPAGYHRTAFPYSREELFELQLAGLFGRKIAEVNVTLADVNAIESGCISFLTHPGEFINADIEPIAIASRKTGVPLEINERHPMSPRDIGIACDLGATFVVSSDAHRPCDVGKAPRAIKNLLLSGADLSSALNISE